MHLGFSFQLWPRVSPFHGGRQDGLLEWVRMSDAEKRAWACKHDRFHYVTNPNKLDTVKKCKVFPHDHMSYFIKTLNIRPLICSKSTCKQSLVLKPWLHFYPAKNRVWVFTFLQLHNTVINRFSGLVSGAVQSFASFVFFILNIFELTAEKIGCTLWSRQRSPHVQTHLRGNRWVSESFEDCVSMPFEEFERVWQHLEDCFEACFMALQWFWIWLCWVWKTAWKLSPPEALAAFQRVKDKDVVTYNATITSCTKAGNVRWSPERSER